METKEELLRLAMQGNIEAQFVLGEYYYDVEKNIHEASKWYEKAALKGHTESQFCLGINYYFGDQGFPVDIEKSRHWFGKAAEKGHTRAQRRLGEIYAKEQNFIEAIKWYSKAAVKKDKLAMFYLARLNESPDAFPGTDINVAVKLYGELSEEPFNDKGAMVNLAYLFCTGHYIDRDADKGRLLIEKCNLFIDSKVQLYDEIDIFELYRVGVLYCLGLINTSNKPDLDDLEKGIMLLDIVIADGLAGFSKRTLNHAKECRENAKKMRDVLIHQKKWSMDDNYIANVGEYFTGCFSENAIRENLQLRRRMDSLSTLGSNPRQTCRVSEKKRFYLDDFEKNEKYVDERISDLKMIDPDHELIGRYQIFKNQLIKLRRLVMDF